jgi:hypothetical protein
LSKRPAYRPLAKSNKAITKNQPTWTAKLTKLYHLPTLFLNKPKGSPKEKNDDRTFLIITILLPFIIMIIFIIYNIHHHHRGLNLWITFKKADI